MKIILLDSNILFSQCVGYVLSLEPDIEVVGVAGSAAEAVEMVARQKPDIVLMEDDLPDATGADSARRIQAGWPGCKIIFLTLGVDEETLHKAIRYGAKGLLRKDISPKELVAALRTLFQGEEILSEAIVAPSNEEYHWKKAGAIQIEPSAAALSRRQIEVLILLAAGLTTKMIGSQLNLSPHTVTSYLQIIYKKLQVPDRWAAAYYARANGLVQ